MILAEVAVEPTVFDDWKDFRYLFEKFGFDKGPLISRFPESWLRLALERAGELRNCGGVTELEYKRIEESLRRYQHDRMTRTDRPYEPKKAWGKNAAAQHAVSPFWLIVGKQHEKDCDAFRVLEEIGDDTFAELGEARIPRSAEDYAETARLLVRNSREILFVDPYLSPSRKHMKTLWRILENSRLREGGLARVELHLRFDERRSPSFEEFSSRCREAFRREASKLPGLRVFRWSHEELPEDFHARYLLTEIGGIRFDRGFDEPFDLDERKARVDVALLSGRLQRELWQYFQPENSPLTLVDSWPA